MEGLTWGSFSSANHWRCLARVLLLKACSVRQGLLAPRSGEIGVTLELFDRRALVRLANFSLPTTWEGAGAWYSTG